MINGTFCIYRLEMGEVITINEKKTKKKRTDITKHYLCWNT